MSVWLDALHYKNTRTCGEFYLVFISDLATYRDLPFAMTTTAADMVGHFCKYCGIGTKEDDFLTYEGLESHLNNPDNLCYSVHRMEFVSLKPERQAALYNYVYTENDDNCDVYYYYYQHNDKLTPKIWLCRISGDYSCECEFHTKEELKEHMKDCKQGHGVSS